MVPHDGAMTTGRMEPPVAADSSMDAIVQGTVEGLQLLLNIIAMLIVLVTMVGLVNAFLGICPTVADLPLTLQRILGWLFAPLAWSLGIPWHESPVAGSLLGTKKVLNELVAYLELAGLDPGVLSYCSRLIMTYALCGFANLGSLGIMLGGMGAMAPQRRPEIVSPGSSQFSAVLWTPV
jgi:CNT family concentrative nucleoside transporter